MFSLCVHSEGVMTENNFINSFSLSNDAINGRKKKDLICHIENMKGKVIVGKNNQCL